MRISDWSSDVCSSDLHAVLAEALAGAGIPADAVQLVPTTDRAAVGAMLQAAGLIDMIVPRGGKSLVARVQAEARRTEERRGGKELCSTCRSRGVPFP